MHAENGTGILEMRVRLLFPREVDGNEPRVEIVAVDDVGRHIECLERLHHGEVEKYRSLVLVLEPFSICGGVNVFTPVEMVVVNKVDFYISARFRTCVYTERIHRAPDGDAQTVDAADLLDDMLLAVDRCVERGEHGHARSELLELVRQRAHDVGQSSDFRVGHDLGRHNRYFDFF